MSNFPASPSLTPGSGLLFVVSAPAGTGKTTLVRKVVERFSNVVESISTTTRQKRPGEIEGKDYFFTSITEFENSVNAGEFLEYATFLDNYYGTSTERLKKQRESGNHVILTIDTQGALQLKNQVDAIFIFLLPPSEEELRRRLEGRKTESKKIIESRLERAKKELAVADQYDYQIINDQIEVAAEALRAIVIAETHRTRKIYREKQ